MGIPSQRLGTREMSAARMSLREQEQTVARLRIVLQTIPSNNYLYEITLSMLLFLREYNRDIYTAFLVGEFNVEDFLNLIEKLPNIKEVSQELDRDVIEAVLLVGSHELGTTSPRIDEYNKLFKAGSGGAYFEKARKILNIMSDIENQFKYGGSGFRATEQRLALTSRFVSYDDDGRSSHATTQ